MLKQSVVSVVRRPATLWDWQKCKVMDHTMTYWNGVSGNGAQRLYQVLQVTPLALQCESQIRERSKHPRVLTWVCSQTRSGIPVPLTHQRLTILPAQGPADFLKRLTILPAHCPTDFLQRLTIQRTVLLAFYCWPPHTIPSRLPTHSRHSPSPDVLSALTALLPSPVPPHQPSVSSSYFSSASRHFSG